MARFSAHGTRRDCWRRVVAALAFGLPALGGLFTRAENPSIRVVGERGASTSLDIAAALSGKKSQLVAQVAFTETESSDAPRSIIKAPTAVALQNPPPAPPEEVQPDEDSATAAVVRILRPITEVTINATLPAGLLPDQVEREEGQPLAELMPIVGDPRLVGAWGMNGFEWSATKLAHGPLYFEEINLERYGYQCHPVVQPFMSGAHFFLTVPTLPYQMTVHCPRECIYTLGHYRPGSCAPWRRNCLPWDAKAAAVEAGAVTGLIFLIP